MATKRYDGIMKRLAACTLGALLVLTALCPAALAQVQEQKTVRVGWFENHFNITGANGERSGFGYEYQQAASAYTMTPRRSTAFICPKWERWPSRPTGMTRC